MIRLNTSFSLNDKVYLENYNDIGNECVRAVVVEITKSFLDKIRL